MPLTVFTVPEITIFFHYVSNMGKILWTKVNSVIKLNSLLLPRSKKATKKTMLRFENYLSREVVTN